MHMGDTVTIVSGLDRVQGHGDGLGFPSAGAVTADCCLLSMRRENRVSRSLVFSISLALFLKVREDGFSDSQGQRADEKG